MGNFFRKKRHSEILVRENIFRPPKLGARSAPLVLAMGLSHSCLLTAMNMSHPGLFCDGTSRYGIPTPFFKRRKRF